MTDSEKKIQSPDQSEELADLGGPTDTDVLFTFFGAVGLSVISYLIVSFSDFRWITIIFSIIFSIIVFAAFLFGSWCFACHYKYWLGKKKKWWLPFAKWYAEFGLRLWHFPGLWYVVFLVGLYITGISILLQCVEDPSIDRTKLLLSGMQNAIVITFLSVITSVLAHTFSSVGDLTKGFNSATGKFDSVVKNAESMMEKVHNMRQEIELLNNTLTISARTTRTSKRIYAISESAKEIDKRYSNMKPMIQTVLAMCDEVEKYHEVALHPLLAPGVVPPKGDSVEDTVAQIAGELLGEKAPHYAYMSAAIGRYFGGEITERQFPGVLLNVTSYAYYIRTVDKIVHALEPWWKDFEFYTLMPRSPIELFRFSNSQDIDEWLEFLKSYCAFQSNSNGIWKRYFAYNDNKEKYFHDGFKLSQEIAGNIRKGWVLTDQNSWLPRKIHDSEVERYLQGVDPGTSFRIREENPFHDGIGTIATTYDRALPADLGWRKLVDVLLEYHGLKEDGQSDEEIDKRFIYRSVNDCRDLFDTPIEVSTRPYNPLFKRSFKIPVDLFAIRDKKAGNLPSSWRFLIGLDAGLQKKTKDTDIQLAFAPVLDLATMAHENSGDINNKAATFVRKKLQDIFLDINNTNSKTHNQLLKYDGVD